MECPRCFFKGGETVEAARCGRCGRSYNPSVNVYLGLVALVYLVFLRYVCYVLTGGNFFAITPRPDFLIFHWARLPVDIQYHPLFIPILAGWLALLVMVPVMVSLMYGKRGGMLLAILATIVGPSWLLGAVLMVSVWIAGGWTLRFENKFGSAILACVPAWIFYLISSRPGAEEVALPAAYYVPALLAIVIDLLLAALLLWPLGRLNWNARVGGVVLALLCVAPIYSYKHWVGEDEMRYVLLSRQVGLQSGLFVNVAASDALEKLRGDINQESRDESADSASAAATAKSGGKPDGAKAGGKPGPARSGSAKGKGAAGTDAGNVTKANVGEEDPDLQVPWLATEDPQERRARIESKFARQKMHFGLTLQVELKNQKRLVEARCLEFMRLYPRSPRTPEVLFTQARSMDVVIDMSSFRNPSTTSLSIVYDDSRAEAPSVPLWQRLLAEYPQHLYAIDAANKLADFEARRGQLNQAVARYDDLLARYGPDIDLPMPDVSNLSVVTNLLDVGTLFETRQRLQHITAQYRVAQQQRAFLADNRGCPTCQDAALVAFLQIAPADGDADRRQKLLALPALCGPKCRLADNIALELANMEPSLQARLASMAEVARKFPGSDGAARALFTMADLETALEGDQPGHRQKAIEYYRLLVRDYPLSYLMPVARERIRVLEQALRNSAGSSGPGSAAARTNGAKP